MPELTREEKLKIFEKLPKELQDLMQSEDTGAFLLYLGEKYNLDDDKTSSLSKLVGDVILGIVPITSLAQEINSKIISDPQASMRMAQELYAELLAPVMTETKPLPTPAERSFGATPIPQPVVPAPSVPTPTTTAPITPSAPLTPAPVPSSIPADRYREPTNGAPEIVDLRKTPPAVSKVEPPPLPILPPTPSEEQNRGSSIPQPNLKDLGGIGTMPVSPAPIPPRPLTFTKPVEKPSTSLIEANPHLPAKILEVPKDRRQFIMRPPGLPPTDTPHDVLDLRRDKGEF